MSNSFVEQSKAAGDKLTAAWGNHVQTQADVIESDLAAGNLAVAASQLTGTINAARIPSRTASMDLSAPGGVPRTTGGCAPAAKAELSTNKIMTVFLAFDPSTQEYCQWPKISLPDGYTGGALSVRFKWFASSGSGAVVWGIQARMYGDGDDLDQAFGTAAEVTDTLIGANKEHVSSAVSLTPGGTPAGGKSIIFQVYRKAAAAGDTLAVDAKLTEVLIEFPTAYSD